MKDTIPYLSSEMESALLVKQEPWEAAAAFVPWEPACFCCGDGTVRTWQVSVMATEVPFLPTFEKQISVL